MPQLTDKTGSYETLSDGTVTFVPLYLVYVARNKGDSDYLFSLFPLILIYFPLTFDKFVEDWIVEIFLLGKLLFSKALMFDQ